MRVSVLLSCLVIAAAPLAAQQDTSRIIGVPLTELMRRSPAPTAHYIDGVPVRDTAAHFAPVGHDSTFAILTPCQLAQIRSMRPRTNDDGGYVAINDQSGDRMTVHALSPDYSVRMPSMATGSVQDRYPKSSPIKCQRTPVTPPDSVRKP